MFVASRPRVAILREEGSNGDREMVSSLHAAGFQVWDVNTYDLCSGSITLDMFRGLVFVGGFSYADAMGSAKGFFFFWFIKLKFVFKKMFRIWFYAELLFTGINFITFEKICTQQSEPQNLQISFL